MFNVAKVFLKKIINQITAPFPIQPLWLVWYVVETITSLHQIDKTNLSPLLDGSLFLIQRFRANFETRGAVIKVGVVVMPNSLSAAAAATIVSNFTTLLQTRERDTFTSSTPVKSFLLLLN